jgi:hypothetical protein
MNRLSLAALGLATALMVSGAALQVAPAHATTTQLQTGTTIETAAATAPVVTKNYNNPAPIKKKKKHYKHHVMKKHHKHHAMKKPVKHHAMKKHHKKKIVMKKKKPTTT